jgi:pimeloyl-ACP methyl ester carboxylesterase
MTTQARESAGADAPVEGVEHWTAKATPEGDIRLFLWEKYVGSPAGKPAVLFVHGSSMASQPTFDLTVPGRADSSVMDWFARRGFVCWCVDLEGYGRSAKSRDIFYDNANGADDLAAATDYVAKARGVRTFMAYGISSGALRAALFAQRHPDRVSRLALDAFVWTGDGAPTLVQRRKKLPEFLASKRRPIDRAFVYSIFERDHPECAEKRVVDAFADAILALDDSMPNGTYIDMCSKLPVVDPARITAPTLVLRGQYDGIAGFDDLIEFFKRLPNPDKQFSVLAGISHASFQQKNYLLVYHILHAYFTQPAPAYVGPVHAAPAAPAQPGGRA